MGGIRAWLGEFTAGFSAAVDAPTTNAQLWLAIAGTVLVLPFAQWAAKELWARIQQKDATQDAALRKLVEETRSGFERLSVQISELHGSSKVLGTEIAHLRQLRDEDRDEFRRAGVRLDAEISKLREDVAAVRGPMR